ncbi:MAG: hypothetical protein HYU69_13705 [Bacteroidetes bacterium]|nr:hypothetical protein [Bacteroidota bacterium]
MSLNYKKTELFTLIRSMSMSEKRYFKLFASRHTIGEKNNYVLLFELIEKQDQYNEEAIRQQLKGIDFVRHLHVVKNYLYNLILKAMRQYNNEASVAAELKGMIDDINFLYNKGLNVQSMSMLRKAKRFGYKYEQFFALLELLEWERITIMERGTDISVIEKQHETVFREKEVVMHKITNTDQYTELSDKIHIKRRNEGMPRTKAAEDKYKKLFAHPILSDENKPKSFRAKRSYYNAMGILSSSVGDAKASLAYRKRSLDFIETSPEQKGMDEGHYISALGNYIIECCDCKKYREALLYIEKLRKHDVKKTELKAKIFSRVYIHELSAYFGLGEFEKGISIIPEAEKGLKIYAKQITGIQELLIYSNVANIYLGAGRHKEALTWNNKVFTVQGIDLRTDVLSHALLLNLIIHFELKNFELLDYAARSAYRFLSRKKKLHGFEFVFLNFIKRKRSDFSTAITTKRTFKELREKLIEVYKNPYERHAMSSFNFIAWLDSKIEKRPFAEVIKKSNATQ